MFKFRANKTRGIYPWHQKLCAGFLEQKAELFKCQHGTSRLNYARGSRVLWPGKWIFQILKRFKANHFYSTVVNPTNSNIRKFQIGGVSIVKIERDVSQGFSYVKGIITEVV
jgi:hypothetical protein